jgi:ABC-type nitrate/sulfonate/bicarbonate transport system substrate-binding protein
MAPFFGEGHINQGGFIMIINIKIIYTDGIEDIVSASQFVDLLRSGKIGAIQCGEGWLEIRRNEIVGVIADYEGLERRKIKPVIIECD